MSSPSGVCSTTELCDKQEQDREKETMRKRGERANKGSEDDVKELVHSDSEMTEKAKDVLRAQSTAYK